MNETRTSAAASTGMSETAGGKLEDRKIAVLPVRGDMEHLPVQQSKGGAVRMPGMPKQERAMRFRFICAMGVYEKEDLSTEEIEELKEEIKHLDDGPEHEDEPLNPIATLCLILAMLTGSVLFGFLIYALLQVM